MCKNLIKTVCFALVAVLSLSACQNKTVFKHCEMGIVLPASFKETDSSVFDLALTDGEITVGFNRLSFASTEEDKLSPNLDPYAFGEEYLRRVGASANLMTRGYTPYAILTVEEQGVRLVQVLSFYRTDYAYFVIAFICDYPFTDVNKENILLYIDNVFYETGKEKE